MLSPAQHLARLCLGTGGPSSFEDLAPAAFATCLDAQPGARRLWPRQQALRPHLPAASGQGLGGLCLSGGLLPGDGVMLCSGRSCFGCFEPKECSKRGAENRPYS